MMTESISGSMTVDLYQLNPQAPFALQVFVAERYSEASVVVLPRRPEMAMR